MSATDILESIILIPSATTAEMEAAGNKTVADAFFACCEEEVLVLGQGKDPGDSPVLKFPSRNKVMQMISDAIDGIGSSGTSGNLITAPIITGATAAIAGQSVTLTATGSTYLWGGSVGITYRWDKNGVTTDGTTISVLAGETVTVFARDSNGNSSPAASRTITVSTNNAPVIANVSHSLPTRLTLSNVYTYTLAGATDDNDAESVLNYNIDTAACSGISALTVTSGTNGKQRGFTVDASATLVKLVVFVTDTQGLESERKTFAWDAALLDVPYHGTGVLGPGTHTVNVPIGNYTITGRGGRGSTYQTSECTSMIYNPNPWDGHWISYCESYSYYTAHRAGAATTVKLGGTTIQSINGSPGTASGYNTLQPLTTSVKSTTTAITLTVVVAGNGGQCEITWG